MGDRIRLELDPIDVGPLDKLAGAAKRAEGDVYELDDTYEVLAAANVRAKAPLQALGTELDDVNALLGDLARQETSLIRPVEAAADAIDREDDEVNQLLATLNRQGAAFDRAAAGHAKVDAAARKAGGGVAGMGQAMLQSGRIIQDFTQGGLPGILNNFEGFAMAAGLGPGVAGAVTAIGVAVYIAGPKLIEFGSQFVPINEKAEALKGTLGQLEERIEALKGKKVLVPVEQYELDSALAKLRKLQEGQAAWDAAHGTRSSAEKQSGQAVAETLAESAEGESAVADKIAAARTKRAEGTNIALAEARAEIERLKNASGSEFTAFGPRSRENVIAKAREDAQKIFEDMAKEVRKEVGTMLKEAKEGAAGPQKQLAEALKASGQGDLAAAVADVSPDRVKAADEEEDADRRFGEKAHNAGERRRARAAAEKKRIAEANAAAREAENTPDAKAFEARRRLEGGEDEFGRHLGEANFDAISAARVQAREKAKGVAKAPAPKGVSRATPEQKRAYREKQYEEGLAGQIYRGSAGETGVQFTPEMARAAAHESVEMQKKGLDAVGATQAAMGNALNAMHQLMAQAEQLRRQALQMGNQFGDLGDRANAMGQGALNSGRR